MNSKNKQTNNTIKNQAKEIEISQNNTFKLPTGVRKSAQPLTFEKFKLKPQWIQDD